MAIGMVYTYVSEAYAAMRRGSSPLLGTYDKQNKLLLFYLYEVATVYILYSKSADSFYTGSCKDLQLRIEQHGSKHICYCVTFLRYLSVFNVGLIMK